MQGDILSKQREIWKDYSHYYRIFLALVLVGIGILIGGLLFSSDSGYVTNLYTELISIAVTIGILDFIYERRRKNELEAEYKQRLLREARSSINVIALRALEQIHERDWLKGKNSILAGKDLSGANWENAVLVEANLSRTILTFTNMKNACLHSCDLSNAQLNLANLENAKLMYSNLRASKSINTVWFNNETILPDPLINNKGLYVSKHWTLDTDMARYTNPQHPDFWHPDWTKDPYDKQV